MARPSVCRLEFQQLENEYMQQKAEYIAVPGRENVKLQVCVASGQHRGKTRGLHLSASSFTWLFEMPVVPDFLQNAFAIDLLFEPSQSFVDGLSFFQSNFSQKMSLPLCLG